MQVSGSIAAVSVQQTQIAAKSGRKKTNSADTGVQTVEQILNHLEEEYGNYQIILAETSDAADSKRIGSALQDGKYLVLSNRFLKQMTTDEQAFEQGLEVIRRAMEALKEQLQQKNNGTQVVGSGVVIHENGQGDVFVNQESNSNLLAQGVFVPDTETMLDTILNEMLGKNQDTQKTTGKKSLRYPAGNLSAAVLRAKSLTGVHAALSKAKSKVSYLRRAKASGQYNTEEVSAALSHAAKVVLCANRKIRNLKLESNEKDKLEKKIRQQEKLQMQQELKKEVSRANQKRRQHRGQESTDLLCANLKYAKDRMEAVGSPGNGGISTMDMEGLFAGITQANTIEIAAANAASCETQVTTVMNISL